MICMAKFVALLCYVWYIYLAGYKNDAVIGFAVNVLKNG